jgi:hypothetical protein
MFALFFLYALIIAVVIGALSLSSRSFLGFDVPILWIGFSIANLVDRKKKVARQRSNLHCRCHGLGSEHLELIGLVRQLLYDCFFPHVADIFLGSPGCTSMASTMAFTISPYASLSAFS